MLDINETKQVYIIYNNGSPQLKIDMFGDLHTLRIQDTQAQCKEGAIPQSLLPENLAYL